MTDSNVIYATVMGARVVCKDGFEQAFLVAGRPYAMTWQGILYEDITYARSGSHLARVPEVNITWRGSVTDLHTDLKAALQPHQRIQLMQAIYEEQFLESKKPRPPDKEP